MSVDESSTSPLIERLHSLRTTKNRQSVLDMRMTVRLAMLALGPFDKTKRIGTNSFNAQDEEAALIKVLRDRKPSWIDKWDHRKDAR